MYGQSSLPSKIYDYRVHAIVGGKTELDEQYWLAHRYQNTLIEIERRRRETFDAERHRLFPQLAELAQQAEALDTRVSEQLALIKASNAQARRRTATPEQRAVVNQLKQQRRAAQDRLKVARRAVNTEIQQRQAQILSLAEQTVSARPLAAQLRPKARKMAIRQEYLQQLAAARFDFGELAADQEVKAARANCGLYSGTYLDVETRIPHTGAPPKFRRWTREGKLAVQFVGGLTPAELYAGESRLLELHDRREDGRCNGPAMLARVRIGSAADRSPIFADVKFWMSRPLPDGCQIKWVYLVRRMVAHHERYALQFVISSPDGFPRDDEIQENDRMGVNFGWRVRPGGLRVAYWFGDDGDEGEVLLPDAWLALIHRTMSIQSEMDKQFDRMRNELADWLEVPGRVCPPWLQEAAQHLRLWRSAARLYRLRMDWLQQRFAGDESIFDPLNAWARENRKRFDELRAKQTKFDNKRAELYRKFADTMAQRYHGVVIPDVNLKQLAQQPDAADEVSPTYQLYRRLANTSDFRRFLEERFATHTIVDAAHITDACHACGRLDEFDAAAELQHTCSHCGVTWDQDANAARNVIARAGLAEPVPAEA